MKNSTLRATPPIETDPRLVSSLFSLLLVLSAVAQTPRDDDGFLVNMGQATLIHGSTSPNKKWAVFHVTYRDTTSFAFLFGRTDRRALAGLVPVFHSISNGRLDRQPTNAFQILWNEDSSLAAIHDSGAKHSRLLLFRAQGEKFVEIQTPDLLKAAFPESQPIRQSGQVPLRWLARDRLLVNIRFRSDSESKQKQIELHTETNGVITIVQGSTLGPQ